MGKIPRLSVTQILAWADAWRKRTGHWPRCYEVGRIPGTQGETWAKIDAATRVGRRGLAGGSSLSRLLERTRGLRKGSRLGTTLTEEQILAWADAWYQRTGQWPGAKAGIIPGAPGENWSKINASLAYGGHGLPGGSSLALLLESQRGVRRWRGSDLSEEQILAWANEYRERTGSWPNTRSGPIPGTKNTTWISIDQALRDGYCGLPGGATLTRLLVQRLGIRSPKHAPQLTVRQILTWADAHFKRTGTWPRNSAGQIPESPGETWGSVNSALMDGRRGQNGRCTLFRLLCKHRPVRAKRLLTQEQILAWADAHYERTGKWPSQLSGPVFNTDEIWTNINSCLLQGRRGLPGGSSLSRLLWKHRKKQPGSQVR